MKTAPSYTASGLQMLCVVFAKAQKSLPDELHTTVHQPSHTSYNSHRRKFTQSTNKKTIIQREKSGSICWHTITVMLMKCNSKLNNVQPLTTECKRTTNESHVTSAHRYQHAVCLCTNVTTKPHQVQSNTETSNPRSRGNTGARGYYGKMRQLRWLLSSKQQPAKETGTLPCLG